MQYYKNFMRTTDIEVPITSILITSCFKISLKNSLYVKNIARYLSSDLTQT